METKSTRKYYKIDHETELWEETAERTTWSDYLIDPEIQPQFIRYHIESDGVSRKQFAVTFNKKMQDFLSKPWP